MRSKKPRGWGWLNFKTRNVNLKYLSTRLTNSNAFALNDDLVKENKDIDNALLWLFECTVLTKITRARTGARSAAWFLKFLT